MRIEPVCKEDALTLLEIYAPYVEKTAVTFEYEVPTLAEFESRIINITKKFPYLKLLNEDKQIVGYAYAAAFKERRAYDWSVETTIYIKESERYKGYGCVLYNELEDELRKMGILNANACIALPKMEDSTLSLDSVKFQ